MSDMAEQFLTLMADPDGDTQGRMAAWNRIQFKGFFLVAPSQEAD